VCGVGESVGAGRQHEAGGGSFFLLDQARETVRLRAIDPPMQSAIDGGQIVGVVRSGAVTPTLNRFIGFALVAPPREIGETLTVRSSSGLAHITLARKGLYDPNNDRLRVHPS